MDNKMTFEQANQKLDETVRKLEDKSLSLAESMELYAQACELLRFCVKELDAYKGQITEIHKRIIEKREEEQ
ncbi:MAG: exodeoxyribonuclease VII small subunit [Ruminococcus sp.]